MTALNLGIAGMNCASCVGRVEQAIRAVPGVIGARVNLVNEQASIELDAGMDAAPVIRAIEQAGYQVRQSFVDLDIRGMTCASCVNRVRQALTGAEGVIGAEVNLASERARVTIGPDISSTTLIDAVRKAGFSATLQSATPDKARNTEGWKLLLAILLSLPLVLPMFLAPFGIDVALSGVAQMLLAAPVQFWLGARFYRAGWGAVKARTGNMDLLVAIGTSAAFVYSLWLMVQDRILGTVSHYYFETSAVVVTLVLLGKWLEGRAKRQTGDALRALRQLRPERARRRTADGSEEDVAVDMLAPGDLLVVRPGERIAADGLVIEGQSAVDQSLITGESLPVPVQPGAKVTGGAINADGLLLVETTAVGAETTLARIVRMVETAQAQKAPIEKLVDRVAAVFVPAVLLVALVTLVGWLLAGAGMERALLNSVAVLVIACPCALGLATPTAVVTGTGVAARAGILIRDVDALQTARRVTDILFDKTGTLTTGRPMVSALNAAEGFSEQQLLQLAAALQQSSDHPLARAVMERTATEQLQTPAVTDFTVLAGRGTRGIVDGETTLIGSLRLMQEQRIDTGPLQAQAQALQEDGNSVSWVARTTPAPQLVGLLAFADQPRESARAAIRILHDRGIRSSMLTGDNEGAARSIARQLDMDDWIADVLPEGKAHEVEALRARGAVVAMVGDGVNDAPALAAADVGIAMSGGTDVAMETAGITLMRDDPRLVADALEISARTQNKIIQGLFWAFAYNTLGIPLAALGYLSPILAGGAMALSSISVVLNALMLRRWQPQARGDSH